MQLQTDGVVLWAQPVGENDRLLTILTRANGLVRTFARGARNFRSPNVAATQQLAYSNFYIYMGRDSNSLNNSTPIRTFFGLHSDLNRLTLAQYFCELTGALAPEGEKAEEHLRLLLNAFHLLETGAHPPRIIKAALEMRMMALSGYMPDLVGCCKCGQYEPAAMAFQLREGNLICSSCAQPSATPRLRLSPGVLAALRHTIYAPAQKLFSFELSEAGQRELEQTAERYVTAQLERTFKTLDFYRRVAQA